MISNLHTFLLTSFRTRRQGFHPKIITLTKKKVAKVFITNSVPDVPSALTSDSFEVLSNDITNPVIVHNRSLVPEQFFHGDTNFKMILQGRWCPKESIFIGLGFELILRNKQNKVLYHRILKTEECQLFVGSLSNIQLNSLKFLLDTSQIFVIEKNGSQFSTFPQVNTDAIFQSNHVTVGELLAKWAKIISILKEGKQSMPLPISYDLGSWLSEGPLKYPRSLLAKLVRQEPSDLATIDAEVRMYSQQCLDSLLPFFNTIVKPIYKQAEFTQKDLADKMIGLIDNLKQLVVAPAPFRQQLTQFLTFDWERSLQLLILQNLSFYGEYFEELVGDVDANMGTDLTYSGCFKLPHDTPVRSLVLAIAQVCLHKSEVVTKQSDSVVSLLGKIPHEQDYTYWRGFLFWIQTNSLHIRQVDTTGAAGGGSETSPVCLVLQLDCESTFFM